MLPDIPYQDWSDAIDVAVEELLWEAGVAEPPVDAFYVARELGLVVTQDAQLPARAQLVRVAGTAEAVEQPTIVLGDDERFERRQFAVAHELGEFAAARVFEYLAVDPHEAPFGSRERVANALAGRLLLPRRWIHKVGIECAWDLGTLKDRFWTASHELIARRMLDMPPCVVVTVLDQGEITWRQGNFAAPPVAMHEAEHKAWRECHTTGAPASATMHTDSATITVRCWPVHEPGWRREIVRTEVGDGW